MSEIFRIYETDVFTGDIGDIQESIREKLKLKIRNHIYPILRAQPFFGNNIKKLSNYEPPTWRYRIGDYRIFYSINTKEKVISILAIHDRKDAYS